MLTCPKCRGYLYQGRNSTLWHTCIPGESIGREADDAICLMTGFLREERDAAQLEIHRLQEREAKRKAVIDKALVAEIEQLRLFIRTDYEQYHAHHPYAHDLRKRYPWLAAEAKEATMREYNVYVLGYGVWHCHETERIRIEKALPGGKSITVWEDDASELGAELERLREENSQLAAALACREEDEAEEPGDGS